jgi:hypothetical protein
VKVLLFRTAVDCLSKSKSVAASIYIISHPISPISVSSLQQSVQERVGARRGGGGGGEGRESFLEVETSNKLSFILIYYLLGCLSLC